MSMKRTKQRGGGGREKDTDTNFWDKPAAPEKTFDEHMDGKTDEQFRPYAMTDRYGKGDLLVHPKFGKGVVVDVEASRVEILFQDGKKKLGHGQPS